MLKIFTKRFWLEKLGGKEPENIYDLEVAFEVRYNGYPHGKRMTVQALIDSHREAGIERSYQSTSSWGRMIGSAFHDAHIDRTNSILRRKNDELEKLLDDRVHDFAMENPENETSAEYIAHVLSAWKDANKKKGTKKC